MPQLGRPRSMGLQLEEFRMSLRNALHSGSSRYITDLVHDGHQRWRGAAEGSDNG